MVRSPAAASRKRRIDSSSEELEEVHHASPRRSKLRKVSVPSPESSSSPQGGEGDSHLRAVSVSAASNSSSHAASQEGNEHEGSSEEDAEYQEKLQLWEMFADEYHDIVRELPRELQRSFQLMLEHDVQMRAHQQALQTATKEYLHLAKSDAYQDAMIKARLARKLAANLGGPEPVQPVILPFQTQTVTPLPPLPPPHLEEGTYANGGEADNGEQVSNHSEEEFQNALVRSASPNKTREHSPAPVAEVETIKEEDPAEHMRNLLGEFVTHSTGAIKAAHDKLALAETAYSWVGRHLDRLDADLAKQEEAISLGLRPGTQPSGDAQEAQAHAIENTNIENLQDPSGSAGGGKGALPSDSHRHHSPKRSKSRKSKSASVVPQQVPALVPASADIERYCYCQQASDDLMVGCDNPDCKYQWFHLSCLKMSAPPEVEPWYCPECAVSMQKKQTKKKKTSAKTSKR